MFDSQSDFSQFAHQRPQLRECLAIIEIGLEHLNFHLCPCRGKLGVVLGLILGLADSFKRDGSEQAVRQRAHLPRPVHLEVTGLHCCDDLRLR